MKKYVCGFLFDNALETVVLIKKEKPSWQKGKWNGVGGHIEKGESPHTAMQREFEEETGLYVSNWYQYAILRCDGEWSVEFFTKCVPHDVLLAVETVTEEQVATCSPRALLPGCISNLHWLVPMALNFNERKGLQFANIDYSF